VDDKFHEIDSDHNGVIDLKELGILFQKMGLDNSEVELYKYFISNIYKCKLYIYVHFFVLFSS